MLFFVTFYCYIFLLSCFIKLLLVIVASFTLYNKSIDSACKPEKAYGMIFHSKIGLK